MKILGGFRDAKFFQSTVRLISLQTAAAISAKRATHDAQQERDRQMHEAATGRDIFDEPGLGERMTEEDWLRDGATALPVMGSNAVHTLR